MWLPLGALQLIEWGDAQRWVHAQAGADHLRAVTRKAGGHATLFRGRTSDTGVFQPLAAIHRRLKTSFDPAGIFNPGRMYKDF